MNLVYGPGIPWYLYILKSEKIPHLYTGISTDPEARLERHNSGKGAKFTRKRGPWSIVYREFIGQYEAALRREREVKSLTRADKLKLCAAWQPHTSQFSGS